MKNFTFVLIILTVFLAIDFANLIVAEEEEMMETDLSGLPEMIKNAAEGAMENIVINGYGTEMEMGQLIYEVQGSVGEECYEVEVTENAQVLEIESCD